MGLGCRDSLPKAAVLTIIAAIIVAGLGVLLQLLGQVGPRRAGGDVVLVAVLRDLQLLDEAHWPERQSEAEEAGCRLGFTFVPDLTVTEMIPERCQLTSGASKEI